MSQSIGNDHATMAEGCSEYASLMEEEIFERAFKLGARFMMEIQTNADDNHV